MVCYGISGVVNSWILHVNALTEKAWEDATGTVHISSKVGIEQTVFVEES